MRRPDPNDPRFKRLTGNQCFCTGCGEYFTTVGNFDRHQLINKPCRHPRDVGLIQDAQGYWQMPGTDRPAFTQGNAANEPDPMGMTPSTLQQQALL